MNQITEARNPASLNLDTLTTAEILTVINDEDQIVPVAVRKIIPALARAVDQSGERIRKGGRVFYVGAGTSGRIGVLDAAEILPTFGVSSELFQAVIAGGYSACYSATEVSEDDDRQGALDLKDRGCSPLDVVVGIAASGETPYTRGALECAREIGALTIAICCNPDSSILRLADHPLTPIVGPEVVSGSTRMKAGTAQKLVLNMFSTTIMVRLGFVYSNWMINVQMKNVKLRARGLRILQQATGKSEAICREALAAAGDDLKVALLMLLGDVDAETARARLESSVGNLRTALQSLAGS